MDTETVKNSKKLWFAASTAIIIGMIYLADIGKFLESIRTAKKIPLIPALLFGLGVIPVWGAVWYRVFSKAGIEISLLKSIKVFMAGNFMNSITPLGQLGGEPIMAYILEKNTSSTYEESFSAILSADIINSFPTITFTLGGAIYLVFFGSVTDFLLQAIYITFAVALIGGIITYLLWFKSGTVEGILFGLAELLADKAGRGRKKLELLEAKLDRTEKAFAEIGSNPLYILETGLISHLGFAFQVLNFYFIMAALGLTPDLAPIYFVVIFSGIANFSPTPGGSGTFEAAMAGLTTLFFPVSFATAVTAAILYRLTTYWPGLILGYASLNRLKRDRK